MTIQPQVSVVMPAYNHQRFVGEAITSVLNQSLSDLELVIIDDGSTDNTAEVIKSFSDKRIRYQYQENQDAYNALNKAIELANGRYISVLNSDDFYTPDRLERLLEVCRERNAKCVFTDVLPVTEESSAIEPQHPWNIWHKKNCDYYLENKDLYNGFLHGNFMVTTSNLFMYASAMRKVGKFKPLRYLHDYDFIFRVLLEFPQQTIYLDDERLVNYRLHGSNTISEAAITGREQDKAVIRKYLLKKIPEPSHQYVHTAVNRLITLEHELAEVLAERDRDRIRNSKEQTTSVPPTLAHRIIHKIKSLTH
ncbi:glycosyltransferase [Pseudomonadota bacterium]